MNKPDTLTRAENNGFTYHQVYSTDTNYGQVTLRRDKWKRVFPTQEIADEFLDGYELACEFASGKGRSAVLSYTPFAVTANLSQVTLEECAQRLGPAFIYTLMVNPSQLMAARLLLRDVNAQVNNNPFAPYVNIVTDESLQRFEWCVSDGRVAWGSVGI